MPRDCFRNVNSLCFHEESFLCRNALDIRDRRRISNGRCPQSQNVTEYSQRYSIREMFRLISACTTTRQCTARSRCVPDFNIHVQSVAKNTDTELQTLSQMRDAISSVFKQPCELSYILRRDQSYKVTHRSLTIVQTIHHCWENGPSSIESRLWTPFPADPILLVSLPHVVYCF